MIKYSMQPQCELTLHVSIMATIMTIKHTGMMIGIRTTSNRKLDGDRFGLVEIVVTVVVVVVVGVVSTDFIHGGCSQ